MGDDGNARSAVEKPVVVEQPVEPAPRVVDWEAVAPPAREAAQASEPVSWEPPPVRRGGEDAATWEAPPVRNGGGSEGGWEAPPVRHGAEGAGWDPPPVQYQPQEVGYAGSQATSYAGATTSGGTDYTYASHKAKKSKLAMLIFIAIGFVGIGLVSILLLKTLGANEAKAAAQAQTEYDKGNFGRARDMFNQLYKTYGSSKESTRYKFMADLAGFRNDLTSSSPDVEKINQGILEFEKEHKSKPLYKERQADIWETLVTLTNAAAMVATAQKEGKLLEIGQQVYERAQREGLAHKEQDKVTQEHSKLAVKLGEANRTIEEEKARKAVDEVIARLNTEKKPNAVALAQASFDEKVKLHPGLAKDRDLLAKLEAMKRDEHNWVLYEEISERLPRGALPGSAEGVNLWICPLVKGTPSTPAGEGPAVLALSRGVVYGLSESTGEARWAMRVGIDTRTLPVRLRSGPRQPELALILSAETNTVTAVETQSGTAQWHYKLGSPCPAGPVLVGRPPQAYFPTIDGKIHVIEPLEGRLLGRFDVAQELTVPGTYDAVNQRLFVPAAKTRIYVLDVQGKQKKCVGILYTGHAVGGLRGAPLVVPTPLSFGPSTLVIAEADSIDGMKIRSFSVPENVAEAGPIMGEDKRPLEYQVPGWSWFPANFDGDTMGFVTDRGYLALFGVNRGTRDRAVFPLAPPMPIPGIAAATGPSAGHTAPLGRAEIAHVDLSYWWLLAEGKLAPCRFDLYRKQLVRGPSEPLQLGIPLQESQALNNGRQLVLVTQGLDRQQGLDRSVATALDHQGNKILWQRQLGFVGAQDPLILGDQLLMVDKLGGLLHVDPKQISPQSTKVWSSGGAWLANGAEENAVSQIILASDGRSAAGITYLASSEKILIRKFDLEKGLAKEQEYRLDSPPAGTAALTDTSVIVPCKDGNMREFPLAGARELPLPITWRDRNAPSQALGHAVLVGGNQLFVSDGLNNLQRWDRGADKLWQKVPDGALQLPGRLATPMLVLPGEGNDKLLCLGDEGGTLHVYSASRLAPVRQWPVNGKITRGPFQRGNRIGVVVDQSKLVWFDPNQDNPLWEYRPKEEADAVGGIVGEPQVVGNQVVVAELSGAFTWLDAQTGTPKSQQQVTSRAVPATAAVPLGSDRALAILSDGTAVILSPPK